MPGSGGRSGPGGGSRRRAASGGRLRSPRSSIERGLVGGVGEGQVLGEAAPVAGGDLARVEGDGADLALADPDLDPPSGKTGVERVVVGVEAQVGLRRDADHPADRGRRHPLGQRTHALALEGQALGGHARGCRGERAGWRARRTSGRAGPGSRARWRTMRAGSKLRSMKSCRRSSMPLAWQSPGPRGSPSRARARRRRRRRRRSGWPPPRWIAPSRSQTTFSGSAPSSARQRLMPQRMSGACLEKISAPAPARE